MSRAFPSALGLVASACACALLATRLSAASAESPALDAHASHACAAHAQLERDEPPPEPLDCFICAGDARLHEAWLRATARALVLSAHAAGHSPR